LSKSSVLHPNNQKHQNQPSVAENREQVVRRIPSETEILNYLFKFCNERFISKFTKVSPHKQKDCKRPKTVNQELENHDYVL